MFEVLVYVYENYWQGDACAEPLRLGKRLAAAGFEPLEIEEALTWLAGLTMATQRSGQSPQAGATIARAPSPDATLASMASQPQPASSTQAMRIYSATEQNKLGAHGLAFIHCLECASALPAELREITIERALAAPCDEVALDDLKIIILMVYWRLGQEPDALVLDELCEDSTERVSH